MRRAARTLRRIVAALLDRLDTKTLLAHIGTRRGRLRLDRKTVRRIAATVRPRPGAMLVTPIPDGRTRRRLERATGRACDVAGSDAENPGVTLLLDPARPGPLPKRFTTIVVDPRLSAVAAAVDDVASDEAVIRVTGAARRRRRRHRR